MLPLLGSVPAVRHKGSERLVQHPGSAGLLIPSDRLDSYLNVQSLSVQFGTDRAALPGGSGVSEHRGEELPKLPGVARFQEGQRGVFRSCFKQTVQLAVVLRLVGLGHANLDGSKFKVSSSKFKTMSYLRLKRWEQQSLETIEGLTQQANRYDEEENRAYLE